MEVPGLIENREKRPLAITAGHRVDCDNDKDIQITACKDDCAH